MSNSKTKLLKNKDFKKLKKHPYNNLETLLDDMKIIATNLETSLADGNSVDTRSIFINIIEYYHLQIALLLDIRQK